MSGDNVYFEQGEEFVWADSASLFVVQGADSVYIGTFDPTDVLNTDQDFLTRVKITVTGALIGPCEMQQFCFYVFFLMIELVFSVRDSLNLEVYNLNLVAAVPQTVDAIHFQNNQIAGFCISSVWLDWL